MAWLKAGDTAAMDERVLGVAELTDADERSVNEVFGFVMRLFLQAAQQETDYRVSLGTAMVLSPLRYEALLDQAARSGLLSLVVEDGRRVIQLVADGEFLHMRTREEMQWESQRKADVRDTTLTVPVRHRDGDACRYCGVVVSFGMRRGGRAGTYDHLIPGQRARSPHEMVVACKSCNSGRRDAEEGRGAAYPLLPPPAEGNRYYSKSTIAWLEENGTILTELGLTVPTRPRGAKDRRPGTQTRPDAPATPAAGTDGVEPAAPPHGGEQRSTASQQHPAPAAPHTSGEQRPGRLQEENTGSDRKEPQRSEPGSERPASATKATAEGTRADTAEEPRSARGVSDEVASACTSIFDPTSDDAVSAGPAETEADGPGSAGSGRDGTGRDGSGRNGGPRPQGAGRPAGGRRRKRGRRRKS